MKMTVLYIKDTGHVMAALTRTALVEAAPEDANAAAPSPEVLALVGDALPTSDFIDFNTGFLDPASFAIPADRLLALGVDRDEDALLAPRLYAVLDGKTLQASPTTALPAVAVSANGQVLTVSLSLAAVADVPIQLYLVPQAGAAGTERQWRDVFKPSTATAKDIDFGVPFVLSGTYELLMLVRGYRSAMVHFSH